MMDKLTPKETSKGAEEIVLTQIKQDFITPANAIFDYVDMVEKVLNEADLQSDEEIEQIKSSAIVSPNKAVLNETDESEGIRVKSPIIGTAYLAPEPGGKKFVQVGDKIKKGQTVMIIEAMKTMNHVPSTSDGVVKKVLVNDGQPVEFGQPLIVLS